MSDSTTYSYTSDGREIVVVTEAADPPADPPVVDPEPMDPDATVTTHDESDPAPSGPVTVIPSPLNPFMNNQDPA